MLRRVHVGDVRQPERLKRLPQFPVGLHVLNPPNRIGSAAAVLTFQYVLAFHAALGVEVGHQIGAPWLLPLVMSVNAEAGASATRFC